MPWRAKAREEYLRRQILADPHSAAEFRANGPVSNIQAFYDAFSVKPGDKMYREPEKRVKITNAIMHHAVDYTTYEGMDVQGWPVITISRGETICENGSIKAKPGRGRFLPRPPYDFIKPLKRFVTPFDPVDGVLVRD